MRKSLPESILAQLEEQAEWFEYLEDFRHASAHRIPAYIPPYGILPEDLKTYNDLTLRMLITPPGEALDQMKDERAKLMQFAPFLLHSLEKSRPVLFHAQLLADFLTLEQLGQSVLSELHSLRPTDEGD